VRNPWLAVDSTVDRRELALLLRRAHARAVSAGEPPSMLRDVVARSWRRAAASGVDPDRPAPRLLDEAGTKARLRRHPFGSIFARVRPRLWEVARDGRHLAALSDANGLLLWADGAPSMLEAAVGPRFLPGYSCNERDVGTNAIGTALAADHAIQIFAAEHYPRLLHGWTCAAAPVHDPVGGGVVGVINLSGPLQSSHPDSLSLVSALARTIELELAEQAAVEEERLRKRFLAASRGRGERQGVLVNAHGRVLLADPPGWIGTVVDGVGDDRRVRLPDGSLGVEEPFGRGFVIRGVGQALCCRARPSLRLAARGPTRVVVSLADRQIELSPRHSEIVVLLALHPEGLGAAELADAVYGAAGRPVTLRAELSRLRRALGTVLVNDPYRLEADVAGDLNELLPGANAPGLADLRVATSLQPR
jgi:hypothetical protein